MNRTLRNGIGTLAACAVFLLTGCGNSDNGPKLPTATMPTLPPAPSAPPKLNPQALVMPRYDVVIAAGDKSRRVGDDAALELQERLSVIGTPLEKLHTLSADPVRFNADFFLTPISPALDSQRQDPSSPSRIRKLSGGTDPASPALLLRRALELSGKAGSTCLAYLVSTPDGDELKMHEGSISPTQLDRALAGGCADAPTVVVVSGCSTGGFAAPPMTRPNRLIMTAAATGRSGFGCGPNVGLTTFDECFLGALDGAAQWVSIFDRTKRCVARREHLVDQTSVEPQTYLGEMVTGLPAPWRDNNGSDGVAQKVVWRQGVGRFSLDGTPYFPTLRQRNQAELEAYRHASSPKALALTFAGTVAWATAAAGPETPEDVARIALQRCEWQSGGSCILYSRGDGLAASGPSGFPSPHPPMLARSGTVEAATVPFIRDDQRKEIAAYRNRAGYKALALGPMTETIGVGGGANLAAARAAALARCEAPGGTCVIFAEGERIVLGDNT